MLKLSSKAKSQLKALATSVYYEGLLELIKTMEEEINNESTTGKTAFDTTVNSVRRDTSLNVLKSIIDNIDKQASL